MTIYKVKAQGYGGSGPSVSPFESDDLSLVRGEIADLLSSDHAVQLYRINEDGSETPVEFEYYTTITVDMKQ